MAITRIRDKDIKKESIINRIFAVVYAGLATWAFYYYPNVTIFFLAYFLFYDSHNQMTIFDYFDTKDIDVRADFGKLLEEQKKEIKYLKDRIEYLEKNIN